MTAMPYSGVPLAVFVGLTLVIGGGAAVMTGRAIAATWRPAWQLAAACLGLGAADRFLAYALFDGPLFSLPGYLLDTGAILAIGYAAWRCYRAANMVRQYPWLYRRAGPWGYRRKPEPAEPPPAD